MKMIDKDALVAEIEKKIMQYEVAFNNPSFASYKASLIAIGKYRKLLDILQFINTLEVKEVDLDAEIAKWEESFKHCPASMGYKETAKHFFELGLNARNPLTWEDIKEICVQSVLVEIDLGGKVSDERHYTEVLKRFKAQKGE